MTRPLRPALAGCVAAVVMASSGCSTGPLGPATSSASASASPAPSSDDGGTTEPPDSAPRSLDGASATDARRADARRADAKRTVTRRVRPSGPSRQDYLRQGNAICAAGSAALASIGADAPADDEQALLRLVADAVVPNIRGQVAGLRSLGHPAGEGGLLTGILDETDTVLDAWAADPSVAFTDTRMDIINARLDDYGLTSCGET